MQQALENLCHCAAASRGCTHVVCMLAMLHLVFGFHVFHVCMKE
jgi:hypothetical protein